jgi:hypothetical protein
MFGGDFDPISNKADWIQTVLLTDAETGAPFDLTAMSAIEIAVVYPGNAGNASGYGSGIGIANAVGLQGSLADGTITLVAPGTFQFWFKNPAMRALQPQTYDVGLTLTEAATGIVVQLFIMQASIVEGFVRRGATP